VKDDNQENRPRKRYFRYAVFSLAALLVLSLGFALIPPEPPAPAEPPFSEQARAAALNEALELRSAGQELAAAEMGSAAGAPAADAMDQVVTLLTIQARALLLPGNAASTGPAESATASPPSQGVRSSAAPPSSSAPSPSAPSSSTAGTSSAVSGSAASGSAAKATLAEFAADLAASGRQRLKDAETADGGMARLLAAAGTAQLLAAERLGALAAPSQQAQGQEAATGQGSPTQASGSPGAAPQETAPQETKPQGTKSPASACPTTPAAGDASLGTALVAAAGAELETVYGYQAALTRLPPEAASPASEFLAQHQGLASKADEYALVQCGTLPPQPAGYVLDQGFLDAPAAGLAALETDTLPSYGDVVALADGAPRAWALSALQAAARRAQHWGAATNPLPGLVLDEGQLPPLAQ
jgi:hypothetical protein